MTFGGVPARSLIRELRQAVKENNVSNGAAGIAFFLMLSVFPGTIVLLSLLPYLHIEPLRDSLLGALTQVLPPQAAGLFEGVVTNILEVRRGGLLTVGLLMTLWSGSAGLYATMRQLNVTYHVSERRAFLKVRMLAVALLLLFGVLILGAAALIVLGGVVQHWVVTELGCGPGLSLLFLALRWVVIGLLLCLGLGLIYYLGPDVEQQFRFVSLGSVLGVAGLVGASLVFRRYVASVGNYSAVYGGLGAVISLMFWFYLAGWTILLGSEVNALVERHSQAGKAKGTRSLPG